MTSALQDVVVVVLSAVDGERVTDSGVQISDFTQRKHEKNPAATGHNDSCELVPKFGLRAPSVRLSHDKQLTSIKTKQKTVFRIN